MSPRQLIVLLLIALPWLEPFAPGPSPSLPPLLFSWACGFALLGLLFATRSGSVPLQRPVALGWLVAALLSSAIGVCQYYGIASHFSPWVNQTELGEAYGNLRQRNQFATLTSIGIAALCQVAASSVDTSRWRLLLIPGAALLAIGNATSSSRTGLVQIVLICALVAVWGGWRSRGVRMVLLTGVSAYLIALAALPGLAGLDPLLHGAPARFNAGAECSSRLTLWANVLQLIGEKPWFGWGWGELDYAHYVTLYAGPRFCDIVDNAHNLPLHLAVELGVPVALLACAAGIWWLWRARPWRETDPTRQLAWSVLAVILLHSMVEYPLWYGPFQLAAIFCLLLLWPGAPVLTAAPRVAAVAAVAGLAFCSAVAWDYHVVSQIYLPSEARSAAYRDDTLRKIRNSWFFQRQVSFAELGTTPLDRANAQWTYETATALLHYSPEPAVIQKVIESATMLGRDQQALEHLTRYRAAFAQDYERWSSANTGPVALPSPGS
jgi:O-antigen ligase